MTHHALPGTVSPRLYIFLFCGPNTNTNYETGKDDSTKLLLAKFDGNHLVLLLLL